MWVGTISAGDGWVMYSGASAGNALHAHPALQLTIGQDSPVSIVDPREALCEARAVLIRPGALHRLEARPRVQILLVEPQSPLADYVLSKAAASPISKAPTQLWQALARGPTPIISRLPPRTLDPNLAAALAALRRIDDNIDVAGAAKAAGLSPSRLRAIAHAQLGTSLAAWLVWRKLDRACAALTRGATLANAAAHGGFADQAHLTRTMRRIFGITPGMSTTWRRTIM